MRTVRTLGDRQSLRQAVRAAAAVIIAASAVAGSVSAASAATPTVANSAAGRFAIQAAAAGLSRAQAAGLQAQVDGVLAKDGGTQVAANEIALPHGSSLLLPLPGQKQARVLPGAVNLGFAPAVASPAAVQTCTTEPTDIGTITMCPQDGLAARVNGAWCAYKYFCAWTGPDATGEQFNVSTCRVDQELPGSGWNGDGSWFNNQTPGNAGSTEAMLKDANHNILDYTPDPKAYDQNFNWYPIWYLDACW